MKKSEGETLEAKRKARKERAKKNLPRGFSKTKKGRPARGVNLAPSASPVEAVAQLKRFFPDVWQDDPTNPAVRLLASEHHLSARLTTYSDGRWSQRRTGDDAVICIVQLQDGTQETRKFTRAVIDADWKRS